MVRKEDGKVLTRGEFTSEIAGSLMEFFREMVRIAEGR